MPSSCAGVTRRRLRLCRVKAVRTMAVAGSRQSHADVSDGCESFAVSKPCGRYRALPKALSCRSSTDGRKITKALPRQSRTDISDGS